MIKLGLTGGIGSGKTTIAKVFQELGAPVYFADDEAKKFLGFQEVKQNLIEIFGSQVVNEQGEVVKPVLAGIVFTNDEELARLNALIHPYLERDFKQWCERNKTAKYIVKEAAILFEAGFDKSVDYILTISANEEERVQRVMIRDGAARKQVIDRLTKQWTDDQRESKSDFIIKNEDQNMILEKVLEIHNQLITN